MQALQSYFARELYKAFHVIQYEFNVKISLLTSPSIP